MNTLYKPLLFLTRISLLFSQISNIWAIGHSWLLLIMFICVKHVIVTAIIDSYFKKIGYEKPEGIDLINKFDEFYSKVEEIRPRLLIFNACLAVMLWAIANKDVIFN